MAIIFLLSAGLAQSQTFYGTTGNISDDGAENLYTANASGLQGTLSATSGLVRVCLNLHHTYDSDLNVSLVAPDGTTINLFSGIGGDGDNFLGTCLDESATYSINSAAAPFGGMFRPQETLGNVNNGQDGNGIWKLKILDTYPGADTGVVNSWSIEFGAGASTPFVFTSSNLPIVLINTGGAAIPDEPKIDATMKIIYNGEGAMNSVSDLANYEGNIGIELRGNYSQSLPQKPYNFETRDAALAEENVPLLGMPEEHDWCLIANYNDKSFLRNAFAYKLFSEMGHYATRNRFCEVVLNGSYQGIYLLCEKIKRDNNRVDIAKLEEIENTGLDLTGGYIIKNDYWDSGNSWQLSHHPIDHPQLDVRLVYEYPKPEIITDPQKTYIQSFINDFENALYGANYADPVNGYNKYIDTDSFIDYFIVNELARNNDGFKKSSFFNKDIDTAAGISKLKAGPVWDFDWAWKNIWGCSIFEATDGSGWAYLINDCGPDVNSPGWYVRLLQDVNFRNKLRCRWEFFRSNILSDAEIESYIDTQADYLDAAQARHFDKWGNLGVNTGAPEVDSDPATFAGQIAKFKNWIALRVAWLDANIPGTATGCDLAVNDNEFLPVGLYPNPANEEIRIVNESGLAGYVSLFDITGKPVLKSESIANGTAMNVSGLQAGFYIGKICVGNSVKMLKIAILH